MKALAVVALLSLGAGPSQTPKGLVLEQDTSHSFRSMVGTVTQEDRQRVYLSPAGVRVESASEGQEPKFYTIFRLEPKDRVVRVEVNGFRRTYREEDLSERAAENEKLKEMLRKRAEEARRKAEERKEEDAAEGGPGLPLDLLAGGLAGAGEARAESAGPVEVKETKDFATVAGRRCRRVEFLQGGEKVFEGWYTEKPAPDWVRRFDLDESPGAENVPLARARRGQKGLELRSILHLPAEGRAEVVTTKIAEKAIAGSVFGPPAGFRRAAPPEPGPEGGADR